MGAEPAEHGGKREQGKAVREPEEAQPEVRAVKLRQLEDASVENEHAQVDDRERGQGTERALYQTQVEKGAADESVGRADQLAYFNLVFLGEDLQPYGIENHSHQAEGQQGGQDQHRGAA